MRLGEKVKDAVWWRISKTGIFNKMGDKKYLSMRYRMEFKKKLNWDHPQTYNEKLQWLKIYDRNPLYTELVDKSKVKEYVADIIGDEYIIPTLGIWEKFEDIDFSKLPSQYVLKCTHDSGGLVICKDKIDYKKAKKKIERCLKQNYFFKGSREWPYKNVKPMIIAEKYMEDNLDKELRDYKFFCFDGEVKAMFIASERSTGCTKFDYYDRKFNHLEIIQHYPNSDKKMKKPSHYEEMVELAETLSKGFPHLRIDFYECNDKIYFGEITFYHFSGLVPFVPEKWDKIFGDWIKLPIE